MSRNVQTVKNRNIGQKSLAERSSEQSSDPAKIVATTTTRNENNTKTFRRGANGPFLASLVVKRGEERNGAHAESWRQESRTERVCVCEREREREPTDASAAATGGTEWRGGNHQPQLGEGKEQTS